MNSLKIKNQYVNDDTIEFYIELDDMNRASGETNSRAKVILLTAKPTVLNNMAKLYELAKEELMYLQPVLQKMAA
jgi:hypothetical protein